MSTPFLTEIDPQEAIKGSRDPLGVQPIWTRLGRNVIGNLTTVSNSLRDFTVTILGYYFAEQLADQGSDDGDLAVFLKWEQIAAYARGEINGDWRFRGTERAKKNLQVPGRVRISADSSALIMSDQKTYGLWGLYSVPARTSGLLMGDPTRLTPAVRDFVEANYLPLLSGGARSGAKEIVGLLSRRSTDVQPGGRDGKLFKAVAGVLDRKLRAKEREFYTKYLVDGGPDDRTNGGQRVLVQSLRSTFSTSDKDWRLTPQVIRHLVKQSRRQGEVGGVVAEYLEKIRIAESVLAPTEGLFMLLMNCDTWDPSEIVATVRKEWGPKLTTIVVDDVANLRKDLEGPQAERELADRWVGLAKALSTGDYEHAISLLLAQNKAVMQARGGSAPWIELNDDKLQIRFLDGGGDLPPKSELPLLWGNPYFIDSLRTVAMQAEGLNG